LQSYIRFILRFRFPVLAVIIFVTGVLGYVMSGGVMASSMEDFLEHSDRYDDYIESTREFVNDESIILAVEDVSVLDPVFLEKLEVASERLVDIEGVRSVFSVLDASRMSVTGGMIEVDTYADLARDDPDRAPELLDELANDPMLSGLVVSKDSRHTALVIELEPDKDRRAEEYPDLLEEVFTAFEEAGFDRSRLHLTGVIPVISEVIAQSIHHITRLLPIVTIALLVTVFIMFRRLWPVFITGLVAMVGVIWTMGVAVFFYEKINILMAMVPMYIVIISFSDVVHLCSSYLLELAKDDDKGAAIMKSGTEVGKACFWTSLTTFAGFISLATVPSPISQRAGLMLAFGAAVTLLLALTLTPILFSIMRKPKDWRTGAAVRSQDLLDRALSWMEKVTMARPIVVAAAFAVLLAVSIAGMSRFSLETDFVKRFPEDNWIRQDKAFFEENFVGTNYLDIFIETDDEAGLLEPGTFSRVLAMEDAVRKLDHVDRVLSVADALERAHGTLAPGDPTDPSKTELVRYLMLMEWSDEDTLLRMIDFDRKTMRVAVHLDVDGYLATGEVGGKAEEIATEKIGSEARVKVTGLGYLLGSEFNRIAEDQKRALWLAFGMIAVMMAIALRSVWWGLVSMVPNLIPLAAVVGYLGFFHPNVDTDIMMVLMVAIGIGVDDTIHFLMRYRTELARNGDTRSAIEATYHYSGRAIVITSVVLVVGFVPFLFSDYFTTRMMGTFLPACLVAALLADLMLVSALIRLGLFRFRNNT